MTPTNGHFPIKIYLTGVIIPSKKKIKIVIYMTVVNGEVVLRRENFSPPLALPFLSAVV